MRGPDRVLWGLWVLLGLSGGYLVVFGASVLWPVVQLDWDVPDEELVVAFGRVWSPSIPTPVWAVPVLLGNLVWARRGAASAP